MGFTCRRKQGLYTGFHFARRSLCFCSAPGFSASARVSTFHGAAPGAPESPDSGPLHPRIPDPGPLSTRISTSKKNSPGSPRNPGFLDSTLVSIILHAVCCDFTESPDSGPLQLFPSVHGVPKVLRCPRLLNLYTRFLFPRCLPWGCSVPGFRASTKPFPFARNPP